MAIWVVAETSLVSADPKIDEAGRGNFDSIAYESHRFEGVIDVQFGKLWETSDTEGMPGFRRSFRRFRKGIGEGKGFQCWAALEETDELFDGWEDVIVARQGERAERGRTRAPTPRKVHNIHIYRAKAGKDVKGYEPWVFVP